MSKLQNFNLAFFILLAVCTMILAIVYNDNRLYVSIGYGLSYLFWLTAFIFSTPFNPFYKIIELMYAVWMLGLSTYLFYQEEYFVLGLFLLPVLIHYMNWAEKLKEKALYSLLLKVEETKDDKLFEVFAREVKKREFNITSPYFVMSVAKLEKMVAEEKMKKKEEMNKNKEK